MADANFPAQHTTTTTTREAVVNPEIRYDPFYFRSKEGLLKILCIIFNLVGFICIEVTAYNTISRATFFNTVAMTAFWFSLIMLVLYMFHIVEKFYKLPWVKIELVFYACFTICYLIASALVASYPVEAFRAAAVSFFKTIFLITKKVIHFRSFYFSFSDSWPWFCTDMTRSSSTGWCKWECWPRARRNALPSAQPPIMWLKHLFTYSSHHSSTSLKVNHVHLLHTLSHISVSGSTFSNQQSALLSLPLNISNV